ncbi:3-methyladenine DNA glycosylase [Microbacterium terricola]|uniref:3-methyladenine DNA glycosylase n=1 Tax=Microbacterium terricola TaxID=344163 RepID=UPI0021E77DD6|nr:3-methyladenine DNA glycosylase [Microbacterium terricola]UYK41478.1 3-methyladenine DNA glycosylase [Microbacterium terricola]
MTVLADRTAVVLERTRWEQREQAHQVRADELTAAHRARASRGEKHPVDDFLFTYYSYKPAILRRWHPGAGVELADAADSPRAQWRWYTAGTAGGSIRVDAERFAAEKSQLAALCERMLRLTAPGQFGCFGLHEWAMVYRAPEHRHAVPLRLGRAGTDDVVEAHELRCTHIDAFRFFTDDAVPRNRFAPTREAQPVLDQPGCLHAGMDVYKWAVKLGPIVPGELLLDAFELARDIRAVDMAASPYDLAEWDVEPIRIETAEGKADYVRRQRGFAERGTALRGAILDAWQGGSLIAQAVSASSAKAAANCSSALSGARVTRSCTKPSLTRTGGTISNG